MVLHNSPQMHHINQMYIHFAWEMTAPGPISLWHMAAMTAFHFLSQLICLMTAVLLDRVSRHSSNSSVIDSKLTQQWRQDNNMHGKCTKMSHYPHLQLSALRKATSLLRAQNQLSSVLVSTALSCEIAQLRLLCPSHTSASQKHDVYPRYEGSLGVVVPPIHLLQEVPPSASW
jgi:hypothetical protein